MALRILSSPRRRGTRRALLAAVLVAAAAAIVAAAASGRGSGTAAAKGTVQLRKTTLGNILVDARGRTLYMYTVDKGGTSACYGGCAAAWPPLLTKTRKPALGAGVRRALVGVTKRKDGRLQVTYRRHPLYTFAADTKAGAVNGQDYGKKWYVLNAAGAVIRKLPAAPAPTTTSTPTTTSSGGGGAWG